IGREDELGTADLMARCAQLSGTGGVLVKMKKPQQDRRADLPVIGPDTVAQAAAAGLGGIAIEAGGCLVLDLPAVRAKADAAGIFEVVPAFRRVLARVNETMEDIIGRNPDVLVTIDSWGFTGRIHERLAKAGNVIPRVRYVAPHVWAWRPGRAKQLAQWISHLM